MIIPDVSQIQLTSFVVTAPSDVPSGATLQLQIKLDGQSDWVNTGSAVGANGVVTVTDLDSCTGYWVRWKQSGGG